VNGQYNKRLLKPKGQEQEREHIQQKKTMMLSEFWLQFNIVIIFVMTLFNILTENTVTKSKLLYMYFQ